MNTPNPLVPQGALSQHSKKQANVKITIVTILLAHVVVLGGFLIQGCKPDKTAKTGGATNDSFPALSTNDSALGSSSSPSNSLSSAMPGTLAGTGVGSASNAGPVSTGSISNPPLDGLTSSAAITNPVTSVKDSVITTSGTTREYTIVKGDILADIAKKNGVSVKALQAANPTLVATKLKVGGKIQIPEKSDGSAAAHSTTATSTGADTGSSTVSASGVITYVVKPGDTLTKIATAHHVKIKDIQTLNHLSSTQLKANQKLKIPAKGASTDSASAPVDSARRSPAASTNSGVSALTNR